MLWKNNPGDSVTELVAQHGRIKTSGVSAIMPHFSVHHSTAVHRRIMAMQTKKTYLVISALGKDRPGIVNQIAKMIAEHGCNIEDSRMTVLGGEFAVILLVEGKWNTLAKVENSLPELEKTLDLTIIAKRTSEREHTRSLIPYAVDVIAMDHPGIVSSLSGFFAERDINIEDMLTSSYAAPHTGTQMFSVHITIGIPSNIHIATLRDEFMDYCDDINLDAVLEPLKN
jgi:glycine cleavage system transcriptional repressor